MSKDLKKKIKEMEAAKRQSSATAQVAPETKISFDEWWIVLQKKKPMRPHIKEVIMADFKARGLGKEATAADYDKALELFGL